MRKVLVKALLIFAAVLLPFLAGIPAAHAQTPAICGNTGSGYCINAWNGGPAVKMYYGGYSNDSFQEIPVYPCSGQDTVQSTTYNNETTDCPFINTVLDNEFEGDRIVEILYRNGQCVADAMGDGGLGACGDVYGNGAANGAFDVLAPCPGGWFIVNRYWTNQDGPHGTGEYWASGGNPGTNLIIGNPSGTCWGGSGLS